MINFRQITLSDKKEIDACLADKIYRSCDFCFTNLYAWNSKFKTVFAVEHRTLFIRFEGDDGQWYYMMPVGKMSKKDAFALMMKDAKENNIPFRIKGITPRMWEEVEAEMPQQFSYIPDHSNYEYIYLSEKLISLAGKKLQSKRNHINRFKADHPDWEYFPLTSPKEWEECIAMLDQWEDNVATRNDKSLKYDYIATRIMLEHFHLLELKGGAIRVNGKIVAFTVGEQLTDDTFVVHVEKAFGEINGAYTIINQQFIEHEAAKYKYINREEDMGIENLRKAKMSYYPEIILEEGSLMPL